MGSLDTGVPDLAENHRAYMEVLGYSYGTELAYRVDSPRVNIE